MGTVIYGELSVVEIAKRTLNKNVLEIAEVLAEQNDFIKDAVWQEANQLTSHKHVRRLALPHGTWRKFNKGVPTTVSQTIDVVEDIGMLEDYSEVDKKLIALAKDKEAARWSEDKAHIEGLSQDFADVFIYGNRSLEPEKINGLATRYNSLSNGNVWDAGGTGSDLTSIWIVQWGIDKVFLIYPRENETVGIGVKDLGEATLEDANGGKFQGYRTHFTIDVGLVIRDERCVQRICNIETSGTTNTFDPKLLVKALNHMPNKGKGAVIYVNETIQSQMDNDAMDKANVLYTVKDLYGVPTTHFRTFPIHRIDAILDTESAVT